MRIERFPAKRCPAAIPPAALALAVLAVLAALAVALGGCDDHESLPYDPGAATVVIACAPDTLAAPWTLTFSVDGYVNNTWQGEGGRTMTGLEPGRLRIAWTTPAGWLLTDQSSDEVDLLWGRTVAFTAGFRKLPDEALTVTLPDAATIWETGRPTTEIRWYGGYGDESVRISLVSSTGALVLAEATPNDGAFETFALPPDSLAAGYYAIRLEQGNLVGESPPFRLAPAIVLNRPTPYPAWVAGSNTCEVRWTGGLAPWPTTIRLERAESTTWTLADRVEAGGLIRAELPPDVPAGAGYRYTLHQGDLTARSDTFTIVPAPPLIVALPAAGTTWIPGTTGLPIAWLGGLQTAPVSVALFAGDSQVVSFAAETPNDGYLAVDVPETLAGGIDYRVRVAQRDTAAFGAPFTVTDYGLPKVQVPNAQTVWYQGQYAVDVFWSGADPRSPVAITLNLGYVTPPTTTRTLAAAAPNTGSFRYAVPLDLPAGNYYYVRIDQGELSARSAFFKVAPSPVLTIDVPDASTVWTAGRPAGPIRWRGGLGTTVSLYLNLGPARVDTIARGIFDDGTYDAYVVPAGLAPGGEYRVVINQVNVLHYSEPFTITAVPAACAVSPQAVDFGAVAVGASADAVVSVTNVGVVAFDVVAGLSCGNGEFTIIHGADPVLLAPGAVTYVVLRYRPQDAGADACSLATATACGAVELTGEGIAR